MKLFHETHYFVYNERLKRSIKICILSDLHYSNRISDEKLIRIIRKIEELRPDYVFFCGDMIDSVSEIENEQRRKTILWWLKEIGMISPLMISIGSHDYFKYYIDEKIGRAEYPQEFFDEVNNLQDVFVLNNETYENDELFLTGYTQSLDYYYPQAFSKKSIFHSVTEDKELMKKELLALTSKIKEMPKEKVKFLLVHAPAYLTSIDIRKIIDDYDFFISGHMHNGCVPPILYELWPSKRGIIAPDRSLFHNNERDTLRYQTDKLIVNGPLTTFQKCSGLKEKLNILYPSYITNLTISNDRLYDVEKVYTKKRYSK